MKQAYDTIVLGVGGIGAGALYWLSRRLGQEVLGLEQFEIGHGRGGSQDHSRIIRLSYHTPGYVELARHAYRAWAEVEADAGEDLIIRTGSLDLWPSNPPYPMSLYTGSMDAAGVGYERLSAAEVMRRWPSFRLSDDITGIYQPDGGIATPIRSNAAHLRLAQANGATIRDNAPVSAIRPTSDGVMVEAGDVAYHCRHLVIAAGAWTNQLLAHVGRRLHLTVTQEQVTYYRSSNAEAFLPDRFPVWIWMDEPSFYGFPTYGEAGPKAAQDVGGDWVSADTRSFEVNEPTLARTEAFLAQILPSMLGEPIYTKTCLYTLPPDRDFVISLLPEHPNISVAVGAGHAYKFAGLIGRILSELALDGRTAYDIAPFFIDRPILLAEDPALNFMC